MVISQIVVLSIIAKTVKHYKIKRSRIIYFGEIFDNMDGIAETLFAFAFLLDVKLISGSDYGEYLDAQFLKLPDNELLLELEWCFSDAQKTISTIRNHYYEYSIDYDKFGRVLFSELAKIYYRDNIDIQTFGEKVYAIWNQFPSTIHQIEPFWTLSYADDPLSWGDEKLTRDLYEKSFRFYDSI